MKKPLGISAKLLIIYLVIAIPMVAIIALSYYNKYQFRVEKTLEQRAELANMTASSFALFTDELGRSMKFIGSEIVANNYPREKAALALGSILKDYPVDYVVFVDATGTVQASTDNRLIGQSFAGGEAFEAIITGNELSGIETVNKTQNGTGFHMAHAIRAEDGTVLGVVGSFVDLVKLGRTLVIDIPSGGANIVDSKGRLVYQNELPSLVLTKPNWGKYDFVKHALSGRQATGEFVFPGNGEPRMVAEVPIKKLGWAAGSGIDVKDALGPIRDEILSTALTTLAMLLGALLISIFIARRIVRSLATLVKSARAVGEGRFDEAIRLDTGDEIEDVARSLDETRRNLKRYVEGLSGIAETGNLLTGSLKLSQAKDTIVRSASQLFGAKASWIFALNETTGVLEPVVWAGAGADVFSKMTFAPGQGIVGRVFQSREPIIVPDVQAEPTVFAKEELAKNGITSVVIAPLAIGERAFGAVGIYSPDIENWTLGGREMELFSIFASQTAIALENARLFHERIQAEYALTTERERLAVTLESIGDGVIATDTQGNVVLINKVAQELTGWTQAEAFGKPSTEVFNIIDEATGESARDPITKVLTTGESIELANHTALIAKDGLEISVADSCAPIRDRNGVIIGAVLVFRDVTEKQLAEEAIRDSEQRFRTVAQTASDAIVSVNSAGNVVFWNAAAESIFGHSTDEIIGKPLTMVMPEKYRAAHSEHMARLVETGTPRIIGQVVELTGLRKDGAEFPLELSLANWETSDGMFFTGIIRDITERKHAETLSEALNNINTAIYSTLDFDEIMQRVIKDATEAIGTETASISLRESNYWIARYTHGHPGNVIEKRLAAEDTAQIMSVLNDIKRPLAINDTLKDERLNQEIMKRDNIKSLLIVPLIVKDDIIGTFNFHYHSAPIPFSEAQLDFAGKMATSVALAVENARLYETERNISDTLQEALLSVPEEITGLEFGHLYRSATEAAKVGGDFYDVFELECGKVGIVIGDVSGKGIRASALTSRVRNTISAYSNDCTCKQERTTVAQIMSKTNRLLMKTLEAGNFVTVFFGVLDKETGKLTYCSAGHVPAIVLKKDGTSLLLKTTSPVIGVFDNLEYHNEEVTLEVDDILVLYTDGVIEARIAGELLGENNLARFLESLDTKRAKDIPQQIFNYVINSTDGKLADDVALLAIGYEGARELNHMTPASKQS